MPFTPFHLGPWGAAGLLARHRIDLPVFLFANIVVDLEPLAILAFGWSLPAHGVWHSFTVGGLLGALWGAAAGKWLKKPFSGMMRTLRLAYAPRFKTAILSGILGVWSNVLLDATLYPEIRLFYPLEGNFLYGLVSEAAMHRFCAIAFVPAVLVYWFAREKSAS